MISLKTDEYTRVDERGGFMQAHKKSSETAIREIIANLTDAYTDEEVLIITIVETEVGEHLCTITKTLQTIEEADYLFEFVDKYAYETLEKAHELFKKGELYKFTVIQYLPKQKRARRTIYGMVSTYSPTLH